MSRSDISIHYNIQKRERALLAAARSPICVGCGKGRKALSCYPIISFNRCKQLGNEEIYTYDGNLPLMCEACARRWHGEPYSEKRKLLDILQRVEFLKQHDPDRYVIFVRLEKQTVSNPTETKKFPTWLNSSH